MDLRNGTILEALLFTGWLGGFLLKSLPFMLYSRITKCIRNRALTSWNLRHVHPAPPKRFLSIYCPACLGTKLGPAFHRIQTECDVCSDPSSLPAKSSG